MRLRALTGLALLLGACAADPAPCDGAACRPDGCACVFDAECGRDFACESCACVALCVDRDGDGFVAGEGCTVTTDRDCDDDDAGSFPGAPETCGDGIDQNCRGGADERVACGECATTGPRECGARRCRGLQDCDAAGFWGPCVPVVTPTPEICGNDEDDDCNGVIDDC